MCKQNFDWFRLGVSILLLIFVGVGAYWTVASLVEGGIGWIYSLAPISLELILYLLCLKFIVWAQ